jgi:hypothetical protein
MVQIHETKIVQKLNDVEIFKTLWCVYCDMKLLHVCVKFVPIKDNFLTVLYISNISQPAPIAQFLLLLSIHHVFPSPFLCGIRLV